MRSQRTYTALAAATIGALLLSGGVTDTAVAAPLPTTAASVADSVTDDANDVEITSAQGDKEVRS